MCLQEEEAGGTRWRSGDAVSRGEARATYAMVKRLAPVQAPPRVTVRQKDGSPTWCHDGELRTRRDAFGTICGAVPLPDAKTWTLPETLVKYKAKDAQWAVAQLSNGKAGLCIRSGGPERLQSSGKQWLDSVRRLHYHRPSLQHGQR